jgi:hypothetical protein
MIKIDVNYTDYRDDSDPNYPGGKAIDTPSDDSIEGTPYKSDWMNDLNGFRQALFIAAFGSINGVNNIPDSVLHSDSLKAILKLIDNVYNKLTGDVEADLDTLEKLAAAIGNDPSFKETVLKAVGYEKIARTNADANHANLTSPHGATPDNEKGRLILRDPETGRAKIEDPSGDNDITNKKWVENYYFPVGRFYEQLPDMPEPKEGDHPLPGHWEIWSHRSVEYGLSQSAPPSFVDYYSLVGTTITAGATPVVCYHLAGDDYTLYKFTAQSAAYTVPDDIELVKWEYLQPGVIIERRKSGNLLTEADYEIGYEITSGTYQGFYVTEVIVPGGKFNGIEGGNRPAFINGGVQQGRIKEIYGTFPAFDGTLDGAFSAKNRTGSAPNSPSFYYVAYLNFRASDVVLTGPDVAGANSSKRLWRRVS